MTDEPKQARPEASDRPEAQDRPEAMDPAKRKDCAAAPPAAGNQKEPCSEANAKDEDVVAPDTRLRDVLIGPAASRRLE